MIKLDASERDAYFERDPDAFFLTDHYRNHPLMLVDLKTVDRQVMIELVEKAWRMVASARQRQTYDREKSNH